MTASERTPEPPAFTEDHVASDFVDAIDYGIVSEVGIHGRVRDYQWGDDEDTDWPFTVVRDGREFEVDIDVRVTELTPELKAKREADAKALLERLQRYQASAGLGLKLGEERL